jgi:hypothetical protein
MWTGHWGPAFFLKTLTPEVPLGALFFVASLPDFIMFLCVLFGVEKMELANSLPGTYHFSFLFLLLFSGTNTNHFSQKSSSS